MDLKIKFEFTWIELKPMDQLPKRKSRRPRVKKFGADAALSGRAVAFTVGELYDSRRRNTALLPVGSVVASHRQANAKAGKSATFKFFTIYMKETICLKIT